MGKFYTLFLLLLVSNIFAYTINFPFPQNVDYSYGYRASGDNSDRVQTNFEKWLDGYYTESGDYARIKFDDPQYTVSEGIGYGMLIMVYMDNAENSTKSKFDKLWNYYNKWLNGNGLMHWKINGFSNVDQQNAATDAELDVALALLMAYKQWGQEQYLTDAKSLISKIWQHEVNSNKFLKPGDMWDNAKNPSYFSTAAMRLFSEVDNNDWSSVIENSYTCLKKVQNLSTGLVPDWCSEQGSAMSPGFDSHYADFHYDAVRTPWRIAMAYVWFGDDDAFTINDKIANWVSNKYNSPGKVTSGYYLNGNSYADYSDATFVGALSCAGMVSSNYSDWVDQGIISTSVASAPSYYNATLKILYSLLLSGNFPNMWGSSSSGSQNGNETPKDEIILNIPDNVSLQLNGDNQTTPTYTNLLSNGDFSNGMTDWSVGDYSSVADYSVENGEFHANLSQSFSNSWQVQLMHGGVSLPKNSYTLLFDAYADKDKPIVVSAGMGTLIQDTRVDITTVRKTYSISFTTEYDMSNQRFDFNLGLSSGNVYIDNVIITSDEAGSVSSPYTLISDGTNLWVVYDSKKIDLSSSAYKFTMDYKGFSDNSQVELHLVDYSNDNITDIMKLATIENATTSQSSVEENFALDGDNSGYFALKITNASETVSADLSNLKLVQTVSILNLVPKLYNKSGYNVIVAPNPVAMHSKIIIQSKSSNNSIKIYNSNGIVVYSGKITANTISSLTKGIYYIGLFSNGKEVALNSFIKL